MTGAINKLDQETITQAHEALGRLRVGVLPTGYIKEFNQVRTILGFLREGWRNHDGDGMSYRLHDGFIECCPTNSDETPDTHEGVKHILGYRDLLAEFYDDTKLLGAFIVEISALLNTSPTVVENALRNGNE